MNEQPETTGTNAQSSLQDGVSTPTQGDDEAAAPDEFRLTIRKLEMPVRPRGVLAE
jgi:hypothetical protein